MIQVTPEISRKLAALKHVWDRERGGTLWICAACRHREKSINRPEHCPRCGQVSTGRVIV